MEQAILWIMAISALLGGLDRLLGNRMGLGSRFEEGFQLLGSTALSMVGIYCLTPLLSSGLERTIAPLWARMGFDPAMLGGILAIDMGGYPMAMGLASDPAVGGYAGIVVAATLGCTVTFTIPVGMGMLEPDDRPAFSRGILVGLGVMPVALVLGGLLCGLPLSAVLWQNLPVFLFSLLLMAGIFCFPGGIIRGFSAFAWLIRALTTVGLAAATFQSMTQKALIPGMAPIEDAIAVVASIGVMMLGSLPAAELLRRALKRPLAWVGRKTGLNDASIAGLLIGAVSVVPAITLVKEMDPRGKAVNAAFMVCAASALAAHMGFTFGVDGSLVLPLLSAKLAGGILGALAALAFTRPKTK